MTEYNLIGFQYDVADFGITVKERITQAAMVEEHCTERSPADKRTSRERLDDFIQGKSAEAILIEHWKFTLINRPYIDLYDYDKKIVEVKTTRKDMLDYGVQALTEYANVRKKENLILPCKELYGLNKLFDYIYLFKVVGTVYTLKCVLDRNMKSVNPIVEADNNRNPIGIRYAETW